MFLNKRYKSSFVVDKSKLTRLLSVIKNVMYQDSVPYTETFEVHLKGAKTVKAESIDQIIELDNSSRSAVEQLEVSCVTGEEGNPVHSTSITFDGTEPVGIRIFVASDDAKVAADLMAVAEEQVERTLERGFLQVIFGGRNSPQFIFMLIAIVAFMVSMFGATVSKNDYRTMWLSERDIAVFAPMVKNGEVLTSQQALEVFSRQIQNTIEAQKTSYLSLLSDWRVWMIIFPILILAGSIFGLAACYPSAVFLWGDAEERYRRLIARRGWILNVVVIALLLGVVTNLAVFAFGSFVAGGNGH